MNYNLLLLVSLNDLSTQDIGSAFQAGGAYCVRSGEGRGLGGYCEQQAGLRHPPGPPLVSDSCGDGAEALAAQVAGVLSYQALWQGGFRGALFREGSGDQAGEAD